MWKARCRWSTQVRARWALLRPRDRGTAKSSAGNPSFGRLAWSSIPRGTRSSALTFRPHSIPKPRPSQEPLRSGPSRSWQTRWVAGARWLARSPSRGDGSRLIERSADGSSEFGVAGSAHSGRITESVNMNVEPCPTWLFTQIGTPMQLDELAREGQPELGALDLPVRRPHLVKLLENRLLIVGGDAHPGVGDRDLSQRIPCLSVDVDPTPPA